VDFFSNVIRIRSHLTHRYSPRLTEILIFAPTTSLPPRAREALMQEDEPRRRTTSAVTCSICTTPPGSCYGLSTFCRRQSSSAACMTGVHRRRPTHRHGGLAVGRLSFGRWSYFLASTGSNGRRTRHPARHLYWTGQTKKSSIQRKSLDHSVFLFLTVRTHQSLCPSGCGSR
jgi:hypothetical protein